MSQPVPQVLIPEIRDEIEQIVDAACGVILGKRTAIKLSLTCLFARGHLLIEDLPGVGKTTLSHVLANILGLGFQRIQFTSDLLPADILGVSVYSRESGSFTFHPGPVFTQLILADEINRATPRTQSALLEAMEEQQVTIEGETRPLPQPFFVIATQNPSHQVGTFPLPESQLDRFMMRITLGYPDDQAERELLMGQDRRTLLDNLDPVIQPERLLEIQSLCHSIHTSAAILDYLQDLLEYSRESQEYVHGLSPRAGLAILQTARAWALMAGVDQVLPEHIQAILPSVINHRLQCREQSDQTPMEQAHQLIKRVPIP